ncbi:MAG: response regulator [Firmicutes bacterium]|nr:response regulator [Bacillota bacterium]
MEKLKKILIVEDEDGIRAFVKAYLESEGFKVLEASNGKEGLDMVLKEIPDLIITDIMMPVMDGIEFFKEVRKLPEAKDLPVIMLTVKDEFNDIKYAYLLGVEEYITKPFDPSLLVSRIRQVFASEKSV